MPLIESHAKATINDIIRSKYNIIRLEYNFFLEVNFMAKLTTKFIQNAICPPEQRMKTYYDELGLQFRIMRATQTKSWLFQYRWEGKLTH